MHKLGEKQLADYKEVFILFDKDQVGVLSFTELGKKALGQRHSVKRVNYRSVVY